MKILQARFLPQNKFVYLKCDKSNIILSTIEKFNEIDKVSPFLFAQPFNKASIKIAVESSEKMLKIQVKMGWK